MKSLVCMVNDDLAALLHQSTVPAHSPILHGAVGVQIQNILAILDESLTCKHLVASAFNALRFEAAISQEDTQELLTSPKALCTLFGAMDKHMNENDIIEEGLLILLSLTCDMGCRERVRQAMPANGLEAFDIFQARVDHGSAGHRMIKSLKQRLMI